MRKTMLTLSFITATCVLKAQVLYGTAYLGGNNNSGTICKLVTATNTLTADFSFDAPDGYYPGYLKLLQASDGKLYGITPFGGSDGPGTIFSYDPAASIYTQVQSFGWTGGAEPWGGLVQASDGKLYGMGSGGIAGDNGFIFSYDPATSIYTKLQDLDYTNGANPFGSLIQASDGNLYGMTSSGGGNGKGVIFSYDPATSTYTKLVDFDGTNGANPFGDLVQASDGKLYGMTYFGGDNNYGVIFSYDPAASIYTKLKDFDNTSGATPHGGLIQASDGSLYGMTYSGGDNNNGVIFSYNPATSTFTKLEDFNGTNGAHPYGDLVQASDGNLYGMTSEGGSGMGVAFSFDPATSTFTKLKDFDKTDGDYPFGSLMQASDGNLYGMTRQGGAVDNGVIFSYNLVSTAFTKLRDFGANNTGHYISAALIKGQAGTMYGVTSQGGSYGAGTIFSYNANTAVFTKLNDFISINGGNPAGSLVLASDGKLYGMTNGGGSDGYGVIYSYDPATSTYTKLKDFDYTNGSSASGSLIQASDGNLYGLGGGGNTGSGVIFSYDPATSTYTKLKDFNYTDGRSPTGTLVQASDGKLYGMTLAGGSNDYGVIFSYDPATSAYTKLMDFDLTNGANPYGSLIQVSDGNLYGMTYSGGGYGSGVIFSYDPATSVYKKIYDFDYTNGAYPSGTLTQASDGKLYGMTPSGGISGYGVAFSYDPATLTYTKLSDFNGANGSNAQSTSFVEIPGNNSIQISIADKSVTEGNPGRRFIAVPLVLSEKSAKIIRVQYTTQDNTATAGSDYVAQSGTLVFPRGVRKIVLPLRIIGDRAPEVDETFSIILSNPVHAGLAKDSATITILDDDNVSISQATQATYKTVQGITLSPNPAKDKVKVMLNGYSGNAVIQLSSADGRILQQQKIQSFSAKGMQQQINISNYENGIYLLTVIDDKGNRQTRKLIIAR